QRPLPLRLSFPRYELRHRLSIRGDHMAGFLCATKYVELVPFVCNGNRWRRFRCIVMTNHDSVLEDDADGVQPLLGTKSRAIRFTKLSRHVRRCKFILNKSMLSRTAAIVCWSSQFQTT